MTSHAQEMLPAQQAIGNPADDGAAGEAVDVEVGPPAQHVMVADPKHEAFLDSTTFHESAPRHGETLYSKCLCLSCSIGTLLGRVVCGTHQMLCCIQSTEELGLAGKGGCLHAFSGCELFMPEARCGLFCKTFCLKGGIVSPFDRPCLVLNNKAHC